MGISTGDSVTIEYVGRLPDGTVFDTSRESVARETGLNEEQPDRTYQPLTVEVGSGHVIEGMESALEGMSKGDTETVTVQPAAGYGERSDERIVEYDANEFREMVGDTELVEGIQVQTESGLPGEVIDIGEDIVKVDFNHELAGETLEFEIEILDVS